MIPINFNNQLCKVHKPFPFLKHLNKIWKCLSNLIQLNIKSTWRKSSMLSNSMPKDMTLEKKVTMKLLYNIILKLWKSCRTTLRLFSIEVLHMIRFHNLKKLSKIIQKLSKLTLIMRIHTTTKESVWIEKEITTRQLCAFQKLSQSSQIKQIFTTIEGLLSEKRESLITLSKIIKTLF